MIKNLAKVKLSSQKSAGYLVTIIHDQRYPFKSPYSSIKARIVVIKKAMAGLEPRTWPKYDREFPVY